MKKYVFLFLMIMMGYQASSYAQAVDDRAVIPVAVTLNSILRLNVKSGGNIEFNFNTLEQYSTGITNTPEYDTKISIASSTNWRLKMGAEDADLMNTDSTGGATMDLGYVAYTVTDDGGSVSTNNASSATQLTQITSPTPGYILEYDGTNSNAGSAAVNAYTISWECGTTGNTLGSLLGSNLTGGRYATNVFFILERAN